MSLPFHAEDSPPTPSRLHGHVYSLATIHFCLLGVTKAHTSYRSILLLCAHIGLATPCVETVRCWMLRLGFFLLRHLSQQRSDWIWIVDHTLQWGTARCLVVLGVSEAQLRQSGFRLSHTDVCVLTVVVVEHSDGVVVNEQFTALAKQVGVPRQIVGDHGSDLSKGIRLFRQDHPEVIDTYDITHKMACLLKGLLEKDEAWSAFVRECGLVAARLRQTAASFLMPPTLRSKARYMNLETLLSWAQRTQDLATPAGLARLAVTWQKSVEDTRVWWQETFGWLEKFRGDLATWQQWWCCTQRAEEQVRAEGIHARSGDQFRQSLSDSVAGEERVRILGDQIVAFLTAEGQRIPADRAMLGSSEVIESVFGSFKHYVERSPWSEIGSNVLLLPVLVTTLTKDLLRQALTTVSNAAVRNWCAEHLKPSRQKRFQQVFGKSKKESLSAEVAKNDEPSAEQEAECRPPPQGVNVA